MAKSIPGQLPMFDQPTSEGLCSAIGSPASGDGVSPFGLPVGVTMFRSGLAPAPVSRGPLRTSGRTADAEQPTLGTSGPSGGPLSPLSGLQWSLENRLRARFAEAGLMKPLATWKGLTTPAGRRLCQLALSEPNTNGSGSIGWPTPAARDGKDISRSTAFLSQRRRHSPSMATCLLERGVPWTVISAVYCLAMGYPLSWNETRLKATETQSYRRLPRPSSGRIKKPVSDGEASSSRS
jgi:hypothetical protein